MTTNETIAALLRIQRGAERVLPPPDHTIGPYDGEELFNAYTRWRAQLMDLVSTAGWARELVENELPSLDLVIRANGPGRSYDLAGAGRRAAVLIRSMIGWVEGQREALERAAAEAAPQEEAAPRTRPPADIGRFQQ